MTLRYHKTLHIIEALDIKLSCKEIITEIIV